MGFLPQLLQFGAGIQRLEEPVSNITVKLWPFAPTLTSPKYCASWKSSILTVPRPASVSASGSSAVKAACEAMRCSTMPYLRVNGMRASEAASHVQSPSSKLMAPERQQYVCEPTSMLEPAPSHAASPVRQLLSASRRTSMWCGTGSYLVGEGS